MFKKIISVFLTIVLIIPTILPQTTFASEIQYPKYNLKLINTDSNNIEYTYDKNGKTYKVMENLSNNATQVHSEIYEKDCNGQYYLKESFDTTLRVQNDNNLEIIKTQKGRQSRTILKTKNISKCYKLQDLNKQQLNSILPTRNNTLKRSSGEWEFIDSHNGNTSFENFTYGVVTAILCTIATGGLGLGTVASSVVSTIAGAIVNEQIPTVYYKRYVYYWRDSSGMVTKVKVKNKFYYDEDHRNYIDSSEVIYKGKFPW